jgi:hypothetical protein
LSSSGLRRFASLELSLVNSGAFFTGSASKTESLDALLRVFFCLKPQA